MSSTTSTTKDFNVAIVGAGLGGLLLALFLQKECPELQVTIYESAHQLAEIGAGVAAWPRVWEVLKYLGLEEDLIQAGGTHDGGETFMRYRKGDEEEARVIGELKHKLHTFHRAQLQQVLFNHIRSADKIIHFNKRLVEYVEPASTTEPIVLQFKDGTSATCDLLVGSDGIRSAVRRTMYTALADAEEGHRANELRACIEPVWSGTVAYRGVIPANKLPKEYLGDMSQAVTFTGKYKHIVIFPISRGELIHVVGYVTTPGGEGHTYDGPWQASSTAGELVNSYGAWNPKMKHFLSLVENISLWSINTVRPLSTYVRGRVALIGDAAHAMTPHQGSGAGQAMEDGFILASLLAHPSVKLADLPAALKAYDTVRRPFSLGVQESSRRGGLLHDLLRDGWETVTVEESAAGTYPPELFELLSETYEKEFRWVAETSSIHDDRDRAVKMLAGLEV